MTLLAFLRTTLRRHNLVQHGDSVVVGVSGGPDSLCLLHLLLTLAPEQDLRLHVAHLNHGLRGAAADADADFVAQMAARWDLPCTVGHADVAAEAVRPGISLEEAARGARYRFLARCAAAVGAAAVAVGHNADDQAETVLMHFLRGSGLAGLRGMLPATPLAGLLDDRDATSNQRVQLIRPLLFTPRAQIDAYCLEHGLRPRIDATNLDTTLFRNRLRHQVLPLLEEVNPQIRRVLAHTGTVVAADYDALHVVAENAWRATLLEASPEMLVFDLTVWRSLPLSQQRSTLRRAIHHLRHGQRDVGFEVVENALWIVREGTTGNRVTLPAGLELALGYARFAVSAAGVSLPTDGAPQLRVDALALPTKNSTPAELPGWQINVRWLDATALPAGWDSNRDPWQVWMDHDAVGADPLLRIRREGDRFQPLGMDGRSKLLAEFFTNQRVPASARDRWPLLVTQTGEFAWVCGLRVDHRARVTSETRRVLWIQLVGPASEPRREGLAQP